MSIPIIKYRLMKDNKRVKVCYSMVHDEYGELGSREQPKKVNEELKKKINADIKGFKALRNKIDTILVYINNEQIKQVLIK